MIAAVRSHRRDPAPYRPSDALVPLVLARSRPAIARMISRAEAESDEAVGALADLYRRSGRAHVVGITGVPGGGKSTLISALIQAYADSDHDVAVLAVDPSSPYSGGAILGDRIRMADSAQSTGAFVRSMATRGHLGGLSRAVFQAIDILDAAGFSPILVETVGVGQDEVDIVNAAHTVVVLSPPGLGDDIQAIKAGVMEIADIHAVSKSDKPEAAATAAALKGALALGSDLRGSTWQPPVLTVSATSRDGIGRLKQAIDDHFAHLQSSGERTARQRAICRTRVLATVDQLVRRRLSEDTRNADDQLQAVVDRTSDPLSAAQRLLGLNTSDQRT